MVVCGTPGTLPGSVCGTALDLEKCGSLTEWGMEFHKGEMGRGPLFSLFCLLSEYFEVGSSKRLFRLCYLVLTSSMPTNEVT